MTTKMTGSPVQEEKRPRISTDNEHVAGQNLEHLFNALEDFLIILDRSGKIIKVNQAALIASGYEEAAVLGKAIESYFPESDKKRLTHYVSQALNGKLGVLKARVRAADGSYILVGVRLTKAFWNGQKALIALARNITEDQRMRAELARSKNQQKALLDNIPYQAWMKDRNGVFLAVNQPFADHFDLSPDEIVGKKESDICDPKQASFYEESDKKVIDTKDQVVFEEHLGEGSRSRWFETFKTPIFDEVGQIIGTTGIAREVTREKRDEEQLVRSLKQQELLTEVAYLLNLNIDFEKKIKRVVRLVGQGMEVSRIYVFEDVKHGKAARNTFEWCAPGIRPQMDELQDVPYEVIPSWKKLLSKDGLIASSNILELPQDLVDLLSPQQIKSILVYPIFINNLFSGFIGFDECKHNREWRKSEIELLKTVSHLVANTYTRHRAVEELQGSERKFRDLVEMLPEMVSEVDANGTIVFANNLALKKFGYSRTDVEEGKVGMMDLFIPEDRDRALQVIQKVIHKEDITSPDFEYTAITADGRSFPVLCYVNVIEEHGLLKGFRGVMVDITERKSQELRLKDAKERAEEASIAKQQFLATMSHEIRTPLNAIIGSVNLMKDEDLNPNVEDLLRTLEFSSNNLLALINDILDFSKIEAGKITIQKVKFELATMLSGVRNMFTAKAQDKELKIQLQMAPDLPDVVIGDPDRLSQILNNLVGNAVKFTEEGTITIAADVERNTVNAPSAKLKISVRDTGIGIAVEKQESIFESFSQVQDFLTRKHVGTGLGLTITKRLIEIQGGEISVFSQPGNGSDFSFWVPVQVTDAEGELDQSSLQEEIETLEECNVLLVEDNEINQQIAGRFLTKWKAGVSLAANGKEALDLLRAENFDIVLMDLQMPVMDGYEACKRIRAMEDSVKANIPIIALTASALLEVQNQVLGAGMNDFVTKPFNPNELYQKISRHVRVA